MPPTSSTWIYRALVLVRASVAFFGLAYIHPDEWHQSGEYLAHQHFGIGPALAWEFDPRFPCRSAASLSLFNLPFIIFASLCRQYGHGPTARDLFLVQRGTFLAITLLHDRIVINIARQQGRKFQDAVLLLLASSHAVLAFMVRPFSNSIETLLLTASISCMLTLEKLADRLVRNAVPSLSSDAIAAPEPTAKEGQIRAALLRRWDTVSAILGTCFAIGFFSRFTFAIFALPSGLYFLRHASKVAESPLAYGRAILPAVAAFAITSLLHIALDTVLYGGWLVVTPLNAFKYNINPANLARHGTHPRWLHALVNAPLLLGAAAYVTVLIAAFRRVQGKGAQHYVADDLSLATIAVGIVLLSIQPHQEPRFLLPLLAPTMLVFARALTTLYSRKMRRVLVSLHLLQSTLCTLLFGILHQSGVTSAHLQINDALVAVQQGRPASQTLIPWSSHNPTTSAHIWSWKLFMPIRHLLLPTRHGVSRFNEVVVYDPPGEHASQLAGLINDKIDEYADRFGEQTHLIMATAWEALAQQHVINFDLELVATAGPHVDMDHLPELFASWRSSTSRSLWSAAQVHVYRVAQRKEEAVERNPI